jgi:16S rRNA (cytidine1402-2'-O)-methyltransferase
MRQNILHKLQDNLKIALVSDAGTPLISDPGYKLVRELQKHDIVIQSLPGPCSVITALTLSGQPTDRFFFAGFLPNKTHGRTKLLQELKLQGHTLVFFESARRLVDSLNDMLGIFGQQREATVIREMTKTYEEIKRGNISELIEFYQDNPPRGEIVIVVAPPLTQEEDNVDELLKTLMQTMSLKDAVAVAHETTSLPKRHIYQRAIEIRG